MKFGINKLFFLILILTFNNPLVLFAENKIQTIPLINLEELSPTFEEEKDELEKIENKNPTVNDDNDNDNNSYKKKLLKKGKVYTNLTALDKITAKTSSFTVEVGKKKNFGSLEIKVLKCEISENADIFDTVAYLQVKDLSSNDNNQVFLFNGWTFASSPTLRSIDHPIYDLWITSCDNV
jgi:hypothetical protein